MSKTSKVLFVTFTLVGLGFLGYLKLNESMIQFNELMIQFKDGMASYYFPFESKVWINNKSKRANIFHDLLSHKYLDGLPEAEVEKLLGKPDEITPDRSVYDVPANTGQQDGKLYVFFKDNHEIDAEFKREAQVIPDTNSGAKVDSGD